MENILHKKLPHLKFTTHNLFKLVHTAALKENLVFERKQWKPMYVYCIVNLPIIKIKVNLATY